MSWWQKIVGTKPNSVVFVEPLGPQGPQGLTGTTTNANSAGVIGYNNADLAPNQGPTGAGVVGRSTTQYGVWGEAVSSGEGVHGVSHSGYAGVGGYNDNAAGGPGVWGEGGKAGGEGVHGVSHSGYAGVGGYNDHVAGGPGVWGEGGKAGGEGVHGMSHSGFAGVGGYNDSATGGPGVWAQSANGTALHVEGDAEVTGDVKFVNGDCAEEFDVQDGVEIDPGMVVVIDETGALTPSVQPYDRRVAGVVSGAGEYRPAIVLDRQSADRSRQPVALVGKVYCKVDAEYAPIAIGDLLTTSPTLGHAMKAGDPTQAFGAVIGKALRPLPEGRGMIPVLIALQ